MSQNPAARLWAGAFALSLLAHAVLGSALSLITPASQASAVPTRFEIRAPDVGQATRVAAHRLEPVSGGNAAVAMPEALVLARTPQPMESASTPRPSLARHATQNAKAIRADLSSIDPVAEREIAGRGEEPFIAKSPVSSETASIADADEEKARFADVETLQAAPPPQAENESARAAVHPDSTAARVREQHPAVPLHVPEKDTMALAPTSERQAPTATTTRSRAVAAREQTAHLRTAAPASVVSQQVTAGNVRIAAGRPHVAEKSAVSAASQESRAAIVPIQQAERPDAIQLQQTAVALPSPASANRSVPATIQPAPADGMVIAALIPDEPELPEPRQFGKGELLAALAAQNDGGCFLALASDVGGLPEVRGFAVEPARLEILEQLLETTFDAAVPLRSHTIAAPQCATIAFLHEAMPDTEPGISITLDERVIASGTKLTGHLSGVTRPWVHLFIVDDDGVVQELANLEPTADGSIAFAAALTLTDGRVGTAQLLFALASDEPLVTPTLRGHGLAESFFDELNAELGARGIGVDLGLVGFRVE